MKWYYLENIPNYIQTVPTGFKENQIPLMIPPPDLTPHQLVQQLKQYRPDVILTNGWTPFHREPYFRAVRQYCEETNSLHVFWSTEDPLHTDYWGMYVLETGRPDVVLTHAYDAPPMYQDRGTPSYYLPFACNPAIHRQLPSLAQYQSDIALVANFSNATMDSWRINSLKFLLEPLLRKNYAVSIWGKGWEHGRQYLPFPIPDRAIRGSIPYNRVPYVYAASKIVLGIQNHQQLLTRRTWECIASGGLLITNHTPAVLRHFQPGLHLLTSHQPAETLARTQFLLQNRLARQRIATKGQKWVHQNHTYAHRVREMVSIASEHLRPKRKKRKSFSFPAPFPRQEIRAHSTFSTTFPNGHLIKAPYLIVKRKPGALQKKEYRSGLLFSLESSLLKGLEVYEAQLKLFLAVCPTKSTQMMCQFFSRKEPPTNPVDPTLILESEPQMIPITKSRRERVFQTPITLTVTSLIRRLIKQEKKTIGVYLSIPDPHDGAIQFLGRQQPKNHALSGLVYYQRFIPRLEITYRNRQKNRIHPWIPFVD